MLAALSSFVPTLSALYLLVAFLAGYAVATRAIPAAPLIVRAPAGFLLTVVFTSWTTYLVAFALSGATSASLTIGIVVSTLLSAGVVWRLRRWLGRAHLGLPRADGIAAVVALLSSWALIHAHLRDRAGELMVSSNTWADMGLHISLSRSFAVGANYPTEYPFAWGAPIRYHFGFDFFAGMLQKGGSSVLTAFNLPGILGLAATMLIGFATTRLLFGRAEPARPWRDRGIWAGGIAMALLITNGSFAWLRYVARDGGGNFLHALRPDVLWAHENYSTLGPYSPDPIAMFNTLNAFLTQMHLIVALAVVLLLAYAVIWQLQDERGLQRPLTIGIGVTFGVAFWLNGVVWLAAAVFIGMLLVLWGLGETLRVARGGAPSTHAAAATDDERTGERVDDPADAPAGDASVAAASSAAPPETGSPSRATALKWAGLLACFAVPALLLGVPQALLLNGGGAQGGIKLHIGYLVCASPRYACHASQQMDLLSLRDWGSFLQYWWLNEGIFGLLLLLGFVVGTRRDRRIIGAIMCVFLWGSLVQVGMDVGGQNHKVFNLWEALAGPFVAFAVVRIWIAGGGLLRRGAASLVAGVAARATAVVLTFLLLVSGVVDFMTIKNDSLYSVFGDPAQQELIEWIAENTPPKALFLTDYDQLYTAPTMAGRGVVLGFSSWASSAGYDIAPRQKTIVEAYTAPDQAAACAVLRRSGVDYVVLGPSERMSTRFKVSGPAFASMRPVKTVGADTNATQLFRVADNC